MKCWKNCFVALLLIGCQKAAPPETSVPENKAAFSLSCQLPGTLTRTPERLERFQNRAVRFDIRIETKSGPPFDKSFLPADWSEIKIPELDFPKDTNDVLQLRVRVWDRTGTGEVRAFPALTGQVRLRADEAEPGRVTTIPLKLALHVPVGEYD